ncbi:hypothetical protein I4U23_014127 [Adineta vaga]|nr:hypothetical protein I4U23_014127 [Adineta vaga]
MALEIDTNQIYHLFCKNKRCFLILLLSNSLLAYSYYIYMQNQSSTKENVKTYSKQFDKNFNSSNSIDTIRNILKQEYDRNDLEVFYNVVNTQFALGLRCMRKANQPQTLFNVSEQINGNVTKNRTLPLQKVSTQSISPHRQLHGTFYSFIISNANICSFESVDLLIIIISKSENYKTRDAIRRTWGARKNLGNLSNISITLLFLLDFDEKLNQNIRLENNLFHDIIQVELPQQYTLVTHRELALWEWSFRYCHSAKFLFKTDDDVFVNLILLLKFISPLLAIPTNNSFRISEMTLYGNKHYNPGVFRQANDAVGARYVVTSDEYPCSTYPDFLSGFGYLIPRKARDALLYTSYHDPNTPFRISDVYMTGILPDYLSLARQPMSDYIIRYQSNCEDFFTNPKAFTCAVGSHHGDTTDVFHKYNLYWQQILDNSQSYTNEFRETLNQTEAIQLMQYVFKQKYNQKDLAAFYSMVNKEFALGLRCMRKTNQLETTSSSDRFNDEAMHSSLNKFKFALTNHSRPTQLHRTFYSFLIPNADTCLFEPVDLLIIIISKSENYKTRDAIRRTWGARKNLGRYSKMSIKLLFLLDLDEKLSRSIQLENNLFHDIIQVELPQHYTLVTHRELALWEWSFRYCHSAKFLFKTDDDIFVNLILLLKFISPLMKLPSDNSFRVEDMAIYGFQHHAARVIRQANDTVDARYIITTDEYPCTHYPKYLSGFGYLIPRKARDALLYSSFFDRDEPFRISDIYVGGILPDYISLPIRQMAGYHIYYSGSCNAIFEDPKAFACAVGAHFGDTTDVFHSYFRYWQHVRQFL